MDQEVMSPLDRMSTRSPRSLYRPTKRSTTLACFTLCSPSPCPESAAVALRQHADLHPTSCETSRLQIEGCDSITHEVVTIHTSFMLNKPCSKGIATIYKSWARAYRGTTCMRSQYGHFRMALLPPSFLRSEQRRTMIFWHGQHTPA